MLPADNTLWRAFVMHHPGFFDAVAYDVRVGQGEPAPEDLDPSLIEMWRMLTTRRIDVIGMIGSDLYIIEVKPFAGLSAIGQLVCYQYLFFLTYPELPEPSLYCLTNLHYRDIDACFSRFGITPFIEPIFIF